MNKTAIHIETPSRLHFGLLAMPGDAFWPDSEGRPNIPTRHFGGAGLMIEKPGIALTVTPANAWSAKGPCSTRAAAVAMNLCTHLGVQQAFSISIDRCPSEHVGLGTGTQLSLAVARAIAFVMNYAHLSVVDLAKLVDRGRRSALGIHGFEQGGFLVEGGKRNADAISPLVARVPFPDEWAILLVIPNGIEGDHGQRELEAFGAMARTKQCHTETDSMCRLLLLGMLPALLERDLQAFGESLYDFNRRAGEIYRAVQGGAYSHAQVAAIIAHVRSNGVAGSGQSSWGPAVFGVTDAERAQWLRNDLLRRFGTLGIDITITRASNHGAISLA